MQKLPKTTLVTLGYAGAFALACATVAAYMAAADPANASGGMQAFGYALLFVGVFGMASLLPTGAALYWLRQHQGFWNTVAALGLLLALSGVAAALLFTLSWQHTALRIWVRFFVLRLLASPLSALALSLAALSAPFEMPRSMLRIAAALDVTMCACIWALFFVPLLWD